MTVLTPLRFVYSIKAGLPSHARNTKGNESYLRSTHWTKLRFEMSLLEKQNTHHGPHSGKTPNLFISF